MAICLTSCTNHSQQGQGKGNLKCSRLLGELFLLAMLFTMVQVSYIMTFLSCLVKYVSQLNTALQDTRD